MPSLIIFMLALMLAPASVQGAPAQNITAPPAVVVRVNVDPRQALIERGRDDRQLNFDFVLENASAVELRLTNLQVSVFDARGRARPSRPTDRAHGHLRRRRHRASTLSTPERLRP